MNSNNSQTTATSAEEPQQIVIMTHMADGIVADAPKDVEATVTTAKTAEENNIPPAPKTSNDVSENKDNDRISSFSIRKRFGRKDSGAEATKSSPIHIPPATKAPKETLKAVYAAGKYKAGLALNVLCVQSFMAGIYIAFAGHLYLAVGGGVLGSALFPAGLIAVILTSAELFTGDALIFVASVLGGQVTIWKLMRNWSVSWLSNLAGSLVWAYIMAYVSDALVDSHAAELAIKVAEKKALNELHHIFIKAIGANFMVCVAVWQGTCAEEVAGKVLALWFPTASFVMMGFDHVVANMFLIPIGMMLGADVSVGRLFAALAMATLGNIVGGGLMVGAVYWYVFDSMASFGGLTSRIRQTMRPVGRNLHNSLSFSHARSKRNNLALNSHEDEHAHDGKLPQYREEFTA